MRHTSFLRVVGGAALLLSAAHSQAATQLFNLDMSTISEYNFYSFYFYNGYGASGPSVDVSFYSELSTDSSGGNTGDRLIMTNYMTPYGIGDPDGEYADPTGLELNMFSVARYGTYFVVPEIGAGATITYSVDVLIDSPGNISFELSDSGNGFTRQAYSVNPGEVGQWLTVSATFTPDQFTGVNTTGALPLRFGIALSTSIISTGDEQMITASFDNFSVSITPVPEPASVALLVLASGMLLRRMGRSV